MKNYDLIAIGGGSGGIATAVKASELGAKCAVIEEQDLGGTCVNVGCVPKKIMWNASHIRENILQSKGYGFHYKDLEFDFKSLVHRRQKYIEKLHGIYKNKLSKNKIDVIQGQAHFIDKNTVKVNGECYTAKHIVIAVGGKPFVPDLPGAELGIDSNGFFELDELPDHVAVIGGGYIGVEIACLLNGLGCKVSFILRGERPLRQFDAMLGNSLMEAMKQQGIEVFCFHKGSAILKCGNKVEIHCVNDKPIVEVDKVLWAIGRQAKLEGLGIENTAIALNQQGYINVDEYQNTNVKNIYALGDVTNQMQLTPVAIAAGRKLAIRLFAGDTTAKLDYENIPTVVFTHPPIATIGLSEEAAIEQYGIDKIKIYHTKFNDLFYSLIDEKTPTEMKLITTGSEERVIGCHIIGKGADEMLQGFAVAIKMGATKKDFDATVAIHPSSAEELVTLT